jgi:hypothetical protein
VCHLAAESLEETRRIGRIRQPCRRDHRDTGAAVRKAKEGAAAWEGQVAVGHNTGAARHAPRPGAQPDQPHHRQATARVQQLVRDRQLPDWTDGVREQLRGKVPQQDHFAKLSASQWRLSSRFNPTRGRNWTSFSEEWVTLSWETAVKHGLHVLVEDRLREGLRDSFI